MTDINETETAERTAEIIRANKEDYNIYERRLANAVIVLRDRLAAQSGYAENEAQADVQTALVAQYDAIMAAVEEALRGQQWYGNRPELKIENEIRQNIKFRIDASIAKHDPRKGAE